MSAASYWEISINVSIGRLALAANWIEVFDQEILINSIKWLPIEKEHCWAIMNLPMIHRDPFDRLLVAQARCEKMALLTADANMQGYDVPIIW
jgi:PIN domain nuclease of toxin-antitoxin system